MPTEEVEKAVRSWLEENSYTCFRNISIGGKFPDIVALKDKEIMAIEVKRRILEITQAIGQCLYYLKKANIVYIVLPSKEIDFISADTKETLKASGIGLMSGDPTVRIVIKSAKTQKENSDLIEELIKFQQKAKTLQTTEENNAEENQTEEHIVELLRKYPEGLTIIDVSRHLGITRQTAAKYVLALISEGVVKIRKIGPAKLCYLKRWGKKSG